MTSLTIIAIIGGVAIVLSLAVLIHAHAKLTEEEKQSLKDTSTKPSGWVWVSIVAAILGYSFGSELGGNPPWLFPAFMAAIVLIGVASDVTSAINLRKAKVPPAYKWKSLIHQLILSLSIYTVITLVALDSLEFFPKAPAMLEDSGDIHSP